MSKDKNGSTRRKNKLRRQRRAYRARKRQETINPRRSGAFLVYVAMSAFGGNSGKHLLSLSFSGFDPERTSGA